MTSLLVFGCPSTPSCLLGGNPPSCPNNPCTLVAIVVGGFVVTAQAAAVIMPYAQLPKASSEPEIPSSRPVRPRFHHRCTDDRIREGSGRPPSFSMSSRTTQHRKSIFRELGLDTDEPSASYSSDHEFTRLTGLTSATSSHAPELGKDDPNEDSKSEIEKQQIYQGRDEQDENQSAPMGTSASQKPWYSRLTYVRRPRINTVSSAPPPSMSTIMRLSSSVLLIAVLLPGFSYYTGCREAAPSVADASVIHTKAAAAGPVLGLRADSPTDICKRWAHQSGSKSV